MHECKTTVYDASLQSLFESRLCCHSADTSQAMDKMSALLCHSAADIITAPLAVLK